MGGSWFGRDKTPRVVAAEGDTVVVRDGQWTPEAAGEGGGGAIEVQSLGLIRGAVQGPAASPQTILWDGYMDAAWWGYDLGFENPPEWWDIGTPNQIVLPVGVYEVTVSATVVGGVVDRVLVLRGTGATVVQGPNHFQPAAQTIKVGYSMTLRVTEEMFAEGDNDPTFRVEADSDIEISEASLTIHKIG